MYDGEGKDCGSFVEGDREIGKRLILERSASFSIRGSGDTETQGGDCWRLALFIRQVAGPVGNHGANGSIQVGGPRVFREERLSSKVHGESPVPTLGQGEKGGPFLDALRARMVNSPLRRLRPQRRVVNLRACRRLIAVTVTATAVINVAVASLTPHASERFQPTIR